MNEKTAWYLGINREKSAKAKLSKSLGRAFRKGGKGKELSKKVLTKTEGTLKGTALRGANWAGRNPGKAIAGAAGAAGATGVAAGSAAGAAAGSARERNKSLMGRVFG